MKFLKYTTVLALIFFPMLEVMAAPVQATQETVRVRRNIDTIGYYDPNAILAESRNIKKDVFISRGWGAGGMPFSVLYMSPHSSKAPMEQSHKPASVINAVARPRELGHRPKALPQISVRNSLGAVRPSARKSYSIIPQLFVSYGWGPAGK